MFFTFQVYFYRGNGQEVRYKSLTTTQQSWVRNEASKKLGGALFLSHLFYRPIVKWHSTSRVVQSHLWVDIVTTVGNDTDDDLPWDISYAFADGWGIQDDRVVPKASPLIYISGNLVKIKIY